MKNPYKILFALGTVHGILGILLWFQANPLLGYTFHPQIMMDGFLTAFVSGFLMTAVPRWTRSYELKAYELIVGVVCLILLMIYPWLPSTAFNSNSWFLLLPTFTILALHLNLFVFLLRRFFQKQSQVPNSFFFLPISILASIVGHSLMALIQLQLITNTWSHLGQLLAYQTFMMGIVIGVGSRVVPAFLGNCQASSVPPCMTPEKAHFRAIRFVVATLFFASYFIQALLLENAGLWLRFLIISLVSFRFWKIQYIPMKNSSILNFGLWISCWCLWLGSLASALFPTYLIHINHILFIGGFAFMTLMISSRVILLHGGFNIHSDIKTGGLLAVISFVLIACVFRVARLQSSSPQLIYLAGGLWIAGLLAWWLTVAKRVLK